MKQKKLLKIVAMVLPDNFELNNELNINLELLGYDGRFLQLILNALDVDYELMLPPDNELGRKTKDGNWTGLIGMLQREEADLSFHSIFLTSQREEVVSFSVPLTVTGITFLLRKPPYEFSNFAYAYPFDILTWILNLCILIIISSVFFIIMSQKLSFGKVFLAVYGSFIHQPMILPKTHKKWNWLFGLWLLFVAVLSFSYTACLLSFLSIPFERNAVRTFRQLSEGVQKGTHSVFSPKGSFIIDYLATSEEDHFRIIGKEIISNNWYYDMKDMNYNTSFTEGIVYFHIRKGLEFYFDDQVSKGDVIIGDENIAVSPIGFAMRKNFSFAEKLNNIISRTRSAGLYEKFMKDEHLKLRLNMSDGLSERKMQKQLSVNNLAGVFLLLLVGISLSVGILIFEIIYYNFTK
ncbi:Glutamate receptor ionotropic like protein [Argiope bruennichi]|uniref:Glutamate receptor ionotropic like protein n=1 Tax=Argiope bruennichi TaxID=94029 RepID=A0A8T0E0X4_ARGBR|nr:Glutamate receptor ionotropic like protein [Argiope bruennichi]